MKEGMSSFKILIDKPTEKGPMKAQAQMGGQCLNIFVNDTLNY